MTVYSIELFPHRSLRQSEEPFVSSVWHATVSGLEWKPVDVATTSLGSQFLVGLGLLRVSSGAGCEKTSRSSVGKRTWARGKEE